MAAGMLELAIIRPKGGNPRIVAKLQGKEVGEVVFNIFKPKRERRIVVLGVYVERGFRHRGIGTLMMNRLHNLARKNGIPRIMLSSDRRSGDFYKALDMKEGSHRIFSERVVRGPNPVPPHSGFFSDASLRRLRGRMKK